MQTKRQTLIEVAISTLLAFVTSVMLGWLVYPLFGHKFSLLSNVGLTLVFTAWSVFRSYWTRRFFNWYFYKGKA